jgi:hypothetical protein
MDNMVSWAVLDSSGKLVSWVLAFDDNGNKNDRDFQDLVVEVSTVARAIPLPAGGSMASVALLGLAGCVGVGAFEAFRRPFLSQRSAA